MKTCLILPYFGKLPAVFPLFLESCIENKDMHFFIFSDQEINAESANLTIVRMSWEDMVQRVCRALGHVALKRPYKLCDYKPAYGVIFQPYIAEYDYWGHCDCDLIFGDLSLLDPYFNDQYERIGEWGHLTFYKNNEKVNNYFRTLTADDVPSWEKISQTETIFGFDEFSGMNILCRKNNVHACQPRLFDDIIFYRKNFYSRRPINGSIDNPRIPLFFEYDNGKLYRCYFLNNKWDRDESLYVHLQKRNMTVAREDRSSNYIVIPNSVVSKKTYDSKALVKICSAPSVDFAYVKMMFKYAVKCFLKKISKIKVAQR